MTILVAYLGPTGTNAETAALAYQSWMAREAQEVTLLPYPSITQTLQAVVRGEAELAVVPVENSIQGSVAITLDTLWQLSQLQIQQALILPISHALLSHSASLETIQTVYSHPQALAQCQQWLEKYLPFVRLVSTSSTTEAVKYLDNTAGAVAAPRAAKLYDVPILAASINDYPGNCTRFWVIGTFSGSTGSYTTLAFSVADVPGSLVRPLQVFAQRGINLTRIESRPTKRSLGEYLFFVDLEGDKAQQSIQEALAELKDCTKVLKNFGSYSILPIDLHQDGIN
ncbi:MAG: prephenate dehydratase [Cyanophyceae cyanobacterium]